MRRRSISYAALSLAALAGASVGASSKADAAANGPDIQTQSLHGLIAEAPSLLGRLAPDYQFYKGQWDQYKERRGDFGAFLEACRTPGVNCDPRAKAAAALVVGLKNVPGLKDDPLLQAQMVNGFVNTMIHFDKEKDSAFKAISSPLRKGHWMQTPEETLASGQGICGDFAVLKYELLRLLDFNDSNVRMIGGIAGGGYHTVSEVSIAGKDYIMEGTGDDTGLATAIMTSPFYPEEDFWAAAALIPARIYGTQAAHGLPFATKLAVDLKDFSPALAFGEAEGMGKFSSFGDNLLAMIGGTPDKGGDVENSAATDFRRTLETLTPATLATLRLSMRAAADNNVAYKATQAAVPNIPQDKPTSITQAAALAAH